MLETSIFDLVLVHLIYSDQPEALQVVALDIAFRLQ